MNSNIGRSGIAAAVLCTVALAGCDSVKDVRDAPFTAVPPQTAVLQGTITGLGNARSVALQYDGTQACLIADPANPSEQIPADCKFYGVQGQNSVNFNFGSFDEGTPYNITVVSQPYGKICTVANASGSVGMATAAPAVNCANDPANTRYDLTVNIAPALQALPDLKVTLSTEEVLETRDLTGQATTTFQDVLFNSALSLPQFQYRVTATTDTTVAGAIVHNLCTFTQSATFSAGGRNINATGFAPTDAIVIPSGDTTVTVSTCEFTATATVQYNGTPAQVMPAGGLTLALRNHFTGEDVQTLDVNAFTAGPATVAFPTPLMANPRAMYELVVTRQPTGMHCIVAGTTVSVADTTSIVAGAATAITAPTASAVLLVDPALSDWWAYAGRAVRCRAVPALANQLQGTYQMDVRPGFQDTDPPRPWGRRREFITFFEDGTFLFGINANSASYTAEHPNSTWNTQTSVRNNWASSSGVTHGFYAYNPGAGEIVFNVFTATNINAVNRGIHGMPGFTGSATNGGNVTASGVVKGVSGDRGTLAMTFSGPVAGVATTRLWTMTEPESIPGELTGSWATADHRRMFSYHGGTTYAFHIGVNALGNLQDVCMLPTDDSTQTAGIFTKHAGSATNDSFVYTCTPGIHNLGAVFAFARTLDLPHYAPKNSTPSGLGIGPTTPRIPPGMIARFPGTASQLDNRPTSPVTFLVTPGTAGAPDTLTVRNTLNGTPIDYPVTFYRLSAN